MDGKNEGKISRPQIKGLLVVHGTRNMVPDDDIKALMRRLDIDGDGEVAFSDFFTALLPYFIYGNLKALNIPNPLAKKAREPDSLARKLRKMNMKTKTGSASMGIKIN
jgi:Ca2+-binding EF-hand superfamily protein